MTRLLKTYLPFTKGVIQAFMAYRANFYVYILGDLFQTVVLLYIWFAIFSGAAGGGRGERGGCLLWRGAADDAGRRPL